MSRKTDLDKLKDMALEAADAMIRKLNQKYDEGYRGYDNPKLLNSLRDCFTGHLNEFHDDPNDPGNIIDMMNFLAMIRRLIIVHGKKLPDIVTNSRESHDFNVKRKERIEEETKELLPIINMDEINKKAKELATPSEKTKELLGKAGMRFLYEGPKDKKSLDVTPLMPDGMKGVVFYPIDSYIYRDHQGESHEIKIVQFDFGVFMYQILSVCGRQSKEYKGTREGLFAKIEDIILNFISKDK